MIHFPSGSEPSPTTANAHFTFDQQKWIEKSLDDIVAKQHFDTAPETP